MTRAFVGIGSNIDPEINVRSAVLRLTETARVKAISTVYRTEPVGREGQPSFYNCVVEIETDLSPRDLKFQLLRRIESELGRTRIVDKFAARTIDLDLILYDERRDDDGGPHTPGPRYPAPPFPRNPAR